jgi:eukaryotic-like serine/threonine-protein kinase
MQQPDARAPDHLPQPGEIVGGKYLIKKVLGRGGMGVVLAATHRVTGREVALKWLRPGADDDALATQRLLREAQAAARVRHPNVVDVYDVGEHDGALFLVMELLEGETLAARLQERGALDTQETCALLVPVMRGVSEAHRSSVIHRDLKPANIFLSTEAGAAYPSARVLDFGVSKLVHGALGEDCLTQTGARVGTPFYMAPEQLTDAPVDHRADIYALGVMLFQCLSGRLPFEEQNYGALAVRVATTRAPRLDTLVPGVSPQLADVVARAMAREPSERFQSVQQMIDATCAAQAAAQTGGVQAHGSARRRLAWVSLVLLVATALGYRQWVTARGDAPAQAAPVVSRPAAPTLAADRAQGASPTVQEARPQAPSVAATPGAEAPSAQAQRPDELRPKRPTHAASPRPAQPTTATPAVIEISKDDF